MNVLLKLLPEPTKDQTAKRAIDALVALGVDRARITHDPGEFQLSVGGSDNRIWLGNLHAECRLVWPWQRGALARKFLAFFQEKPERPSTLEEARTQLLPGLRDAFMFEALRLQASLGGLDSPGPCGHPLGSRLWLGLFLDSPNATSVANTSDLDAWKAAPERCLELALENLAARSREPLVRIHDGIYHSPWHDCYDPARILLRDTLAPLDLEGDPVAFAPNWNHLFVTGSEDPQGLAGCLGMAMQILAEEPRPMTALPLVRRGGEWLDLDLPKGHVVEPLLRKARVLELSSLYHEQGALIEKVHEKDGTDVFVARYNGIRNEKTNDYDSYSVWTKDVVTLLPRTERLVFFDGDQPEKERVRADVDWGIATFHCGPLMEDAGYTPRRFRVEGFPTSEQLAAMRAAQATRSIAASQPSR